MNPNLFHKKIRRNFWKRIKQIESGAANKNPKMLKEGRKSVTSFLEAVTPKKVLQRVFAPPPSPSQEPELWKEIPGIPFYYVSTLGRVCFVDGGLVSQAASKYGRATVSLRITSSAAYRNGYGTRQVHRLVAETFIPNPDPKLCKRVAHIDGNKHNNRASNLVWTVVMPSKYCASASMERTIQPNPAIFVPHEDSSSLDVSPAARRTKLFEPEAPFVEPPRTTPPTAAASTYLSEEADGFWLPLNIWHDDFACFIDPMRLTGHFLLGESDDPFSSFYNRTCMEDTQALPWPLFERQAPLKSA